MPADIERIAAGLTNRPRLALVSWRPGEEMTWFKVVGLARLPGDRQVMSYRSVLKPLEYRGLAKLTFAGSYDPETGAFEHQRYSLTPLGLAVRAHLTKEKSNGR